MLRLRVSQLQVELDSARKFATASLFRLENIKVKEELVKFYTGFSDYATLLAFYETLLESDAAVMRQWDGNNSKKSYDESKCGRPCILSMMEVFPYLSKALPWIFRVGSCPKVWDIALPYI